MTGARPDPQPGRPAAGRDPATRAPAPTPATAPAPPPAPAAPTPLVLAAQARAAGAPAAPAGGRAAEVAPQAGGRDHGGGLDAAVARWGGRRANWLDLSTGINPVPYPVAGIPGDGWTALPDRAAVAALEAAARAFWVVPAGAEVLAAPGASALIARMPLALAGRATAEAGAPPAVAIPGPTYNEHAAAFAAQGWEVRQVGQALAQVIVHPNNPDGRLWRAQDLAAPCAVIDESFCDIAPQRSLIACATRPGTVILKSFGKFWGLAGLRLGFAIGDPAIVGALREALGPWPVSGPALHIGAQALCDQGWAAATRARLEGDAARLDALMQARGARALGGTTLFRLYDTAPGGGAASGRFATPAPFSASAPSPAGTDAPPGPARDWQERLARGHVWSRVFPYSDRWLRLGLPHPDRWDRLEAALA